jgi:hypothetical protein
MYFTAPALLALLSATVAVAAPAAHKGDDKPYYNKDKYNKDCQDDWEKKWKNDEWKKDENLFYYNAEYYVKATPDQVISQAGAPVPGQPGAKGIFKYGINVAENTICYVSQHVFFVTQAKHQTNELYRTSLSPVLQANICRLQ